MGSVRSTRVLLVLLVGSVVLRGIVWSIALPPWQAPDEIDHYRYTERIAQGALPRNDSADFRSEAVAVSLAFTLYEANRYLAPGRPMDPELRRSSSGGEPPGLSQNGGTAGGATGYPPLYYALELPAYELPGLDTAGSRLAAMRVESSLIAALAVVLTFLLAVRLGATPPLALGAGLVVSAAPLFSQASATVNPDILLVTGTTGLALSAVRLLQNGFSWRRLFALAAWAAVVALSKPIGLVAAPLVPAAFFGPSVLRRCGLRRAEHVASAGLIAVVLFAASAIRFHFANAEGVRFTLSYIWQFYLPPLPFMTDLFPPGPVLAETVWLEQGSGWFGWLAIRVPDPAADLEIWTTGAVALLTVVLAVGVVRRHASFRRLAASALVVMLLYVLSLHLADLSTFRSGASILQGRYLLPILPLSAALMVAVVSLSRFRLVGHLALGALASAWLYANVVGLATVLDAFSS